MRMFKRDIGKWKKAITKYDKKAQVLCKKIKTTLKKNEKKMTPSETHEAIDYFSKLLILSCFN